MSQPYLAVVPDAALPDPVESPTTVATASIALPLFSKPYAWYVLAMLCLANTFASLDRFAFSLLIEPIKREFHASDTDMGLLSGMAFVVFYVLLGIPVARWVDRGNRKNILALAIAAWSFATLLGGMASSFIHLALSRAGLGAGESGATPASNSLIADYFPKAARPVAVTVFQSGMAFSALIGLPIIGAVAHAYGWRAAMMAMGAPGLLVAALIFFTVREPLRGRLDPVDVSVVNLAPRESLWAALKSMFSSKPFCFLVLSQIMVGMAAGILPIWFPVYLIRAFALTQPQAGALMGLLNGAVMLAAFTATGFVSAFLIRRRPAQGERAIALLAATAALLGVPLLLGSLNIASFVALPYVAGLYYFMQFATRPPAYSLSIELVPVRQRGLSAGVIVIAGSLIGAGLGPLVVGMISDHYTPLVGNAQALRIGLMSVVVPAMALAGLFFLGVAYSMKSKE